MEAATLSQLGFDAWLTIAVLVASFSLLVFECFKPHIILFSAISILVLSGVITPIDALVGFYNSAVLTIALLFILVAALRGSGAIARIAEIIMGKPQGYLIALSRLIGASSVLSAFINNTPVVAMLTDAVVFWCEKHQVAVSKLLIPLSYATILGGMCSLIGTSTNLIIVGLMQQYPQLPQLHIFSPAWVGIPVSIVAAIYLLTVGHKLLPEHYVASHKLPLGQTTENKPHGLVIRKNLLLAQVKTLLQLFPQQQYASASSYFADNKASPHGAKQADKPASKARVLITLAIFVTMIFSVAFLQVSIFLAALWAVIALLVSACITLPKAIAAVDYKLIITIACALALGLALDKTGVASAVATLLLGFAHADPFWTLLILYVMTVIFTEMLTNNATAVLMFPIALAASQQLDVNAMPFIMAVMIGASASFITPIGYQTNMMVYQSGQYRFIDYIRVGTPLSVLVGVISLAIIPVVWPF